MRRTWPLFWLALLVHALTGCGSGSDPADACAGISPVCTTAADCAPGQSCDSCGRCAGSALTCSDDGDCATGQRCSGGACVAIECTADPDCGAGRACIDGACVDADCTNFGCDGGLVCRAADRRCVECLDDRGCTQPARPFCETDAGACVACLGDAHCRGGFCSGGACVECTSDEHCADPTPRCKVDAGVCGTCATDDDCPGASFCQADATCYLGPKAGEPCMPDGTCAPGNICTGGVCSQLCDLYAPSCPAGTGCGILAADGRALFQDGKPLAACLDASSGAGLERPCGGDVLCKEGLFCVPTSADGGICKPYCRPGSDGANCADGDVCISVALGTNGEEVGLCSVPSTWLGACVSDVDCDDGQGCLPVVENGALTGRCHFSSGTKAALAACSSDGECRSGVCLPLQAGSNAGFCWGGCSDDTMCGGGACITYNFNLGTGGTGTLQGCRGTCSSDLDCTHLGDAVCTVAVDDRSLLGICVARTGPADAGDACVADAACGTGICLDNATATTPADAGFCLGACESDLDCGTNTFCREVVLNAGTATAPAYDTMEVCWGASCNNDAGCPAGWSCNLDNDPADPGNLLRTSCGPATGDLGPGEPCTADEQCKTAFCASYGGAGPTVCWGACVTSADCATGTTCVPITVNGNSMLTGCVP